MALRIAMTTGAQARRAAHLRAEGHRPIRARDGHKRPDTLTPALARLRRSGSRSGSGTDCAESHCVIPRRLR